MQLAIVTTQIVSLLAPSNRGVGVHDTSLIRSTATTTGIILPRCGCRIYLPGIQRFVQQVY